MNRLALMVALLFSVAAQAAPATPSGPEAEVHKLRQEIAAAKLDRTLDLNRDQARTLLPLLKEAAQLRDQLKAGHDKRLPELTRALTLVRDDLRKTGVVSDASQKALQEARGGAATKELREKLRALHKQAKQVLTADQVSRLKDFDPSPIPGEDMGFGGDAEKAEKGGRGHHGHGGHGGGMHKVIKLVTGPEFIALVEVRAR